MLFGLLCIASMDYQWSTTFGPWSSQIQKTSRWFAQKSTSSISTYLDRLSVFSIAIEYNLSVWGRYNNTAKHPVT